VIPDQLKREVQDLRQKAVDVEILEHENQPYVLAAARPAPSPPWDQTRYDILLAIPLVYDDAALDGFYLGLPYRYNAGDHPRVNGATIRIRDRDWRLTSWHYLDGKPWTKGRDTLESHLVHCDGFFLGRGASNP
jgi:hypothetical protein